jgi:hypothetical protein
MGYSGVAYGWPLHQVPRWRIRGATPPLSHISPRHAQARLIYTALKCEGRCNWKATSWMWQLAVFHPIFLHLIIPSSSQCPHLCSTFWSGRIVSRHELNFGYTRWHCMQYSASSNHWWRNPHSLHSTDNTAFDQIAQSEIKNNLSLMAHFLHVGLSLTPITCRCLMVVMY